MPKHTCFKCERFKRTRHETRIGVENIGALVLSKKENWRAIRRLAKSIMKIKEKKNIKVMLIKRYHDGRSGREVSVGKSGLHQTHRKSYTTMSRQTKAGNKVRTIYAFSWDWYRLDNHMRRLCLEQTGTYCYCRFWSERTRSQHFGYTRLKPTNSKQLNHGLQKRGGL